MIEHRLVDGKWEILTEQNKRENRNLIWHALFLFVELIRVGVCVRVGLGIVGQREVS